MVKLPASGVVRWTFATPIEHSDPGSWGGFLTGPGADAPDGVVAGGAPGQTHADLHYSNGVVAGDPWYASSLGGGGVTFEPDDQELDGLTGTID